MAGISYAGELLVMESFPVQLAAHVIARNPGEVDAQLTFPNGCPVLLRAYDQDSRLVWEAEKEMMCTTAVVVIPVPARGEVTLRSPTVSAAQVLGGALPAGRYRITATLRPNGSEVELDLGAADLAAPENSAGVVNVPRRSDSGETRG